MFIKGSNEWIGKEAYIFLDLRSKLEKKLLSCSFEYFYGGCILKESIYGKFSEMLGLKFKDNFISFTYRDEEYILSPEYTFCVYEYLFRKKMLNKKNKIFYSQEMFRNETIEDLENGKTFNFWQIGYEIFGDNNLEVSVESVFTMIECLKELSEIKTFIRITDKRILSSICNKFKVKDLDEVYDILYESKEDGDFFYFLYTGKRDNKEFAKELRYLINLSRQNKLSIDTLKHAVDGSNGLESLEDLELILSKIKYENKNCELVLVPAMAKSWNAYTTFVYDVRIKDYGKAIAGGGNLFIDKNNPLCLQSGAGIGVTRIVEYLLSKSKKE